MEGHGSKPVRPIGTVLRAGAESAEGYVAAHLVGVEPGDLPSCGRSHCVFPTDEAADGNPILLLYALYMYVYKRLCAVCMYVYV